MGAWPGSASLGFSRVLVAFLLAASALVCALAGPGAALAAETRQPAGGMGPAPHLDSTPLPSGPSAKPAWQDPLDGSADSGASSFSGPRSTTGPANRVTAWGPGSAGQAATLGSMDSYVGYAAGKLKADQGAIVLRYRPAADLAAAYAQRSPLWTDYGQYKPPQSGFLVDTIGWNAAPKGSFVLVLNPAAGGGLSWGVWDGSKWHNAVWTTASDWHWDPSHWYEIGVTWGPKGMTVLVDGEQKASLPDVVQVNTTIPWFLGQAPWTWPYGPHTMIGAYDEVRVYAEQIGPYAAAPAKASPSATPTSAPRATPAAPPPTSTRAPVQAGGATSGQVTQPATPKAIGTPASSVSASGTSATGSSAPSTPVSGTPTQSSRATPGPIGQIFGPLESLPGGADGSIAGIVTTLDSANVAPSLPGGETGPLAATVDKLPGGTALLCNVPFVLGGGLLIALAALAGFAGGRRRREGRSASEPAVPAPPPPAVDYPTTAPPVASAAASSRPTTLPGAVPSAAPPIISRPSTVPTKAPTVDGVFCDQCGRSVPPGAQFCDSCGARVAEG